MLFRGVGEEGEKARKLGRSVAVQFSSARLSSLQLVDNEERVEGKIRARQNRT